MCSFLRYWTKKEPYLQVPLGVKFFRFHALTSFQQLCYSVFARNSCSFRHGIMASSRIFLGQLRISGMGCSQSIVGDLSMTQWEKWVNVLQSSNLLFMEFGDDFVMLRFQSNGDHFDNSGKRWMRIEQMGFDVRVGWFDSGCGSMVKMSNRLSPSIGEPGHKWNPGLLNIFHKVSRINCWKSGKRWIKFAGCWNLD